MMEEASIMLKYSGIWVEENVYETKYVEGIVVPWNISFNMLKENIADHIGIDLERKKVRLRYVVDSSVVPMEVRNDMGVRLFIMLKRKVSTFERYPLCVEVEDVVSSCSNTSIGGAYSKATGTVECVEQFNSCRSLVLFGVGTDKPISDLCIISDPTHKILEVGQTYRDKKTLVSVMHNYAMEHRFQFCATRSDQVSYVLRCFVKDCPWNLRSSKISNSTFFKIRAFDDVHTCALAERTFTQRHASAKMVAALCIHQLRNHKRKHSPGDIKQDVLDTLGVDITYNKAWHAKEVALNMIMGKPADGYKQLPTYLHVLGNTYPGFFLRYKKNASNQFMYVFIALNASIAGFVHCRPVVVVDGSHLKGPYLGTFVSASTLDGAGNILPLAYGVVDSENDASWTWFFEQFKCAFGVHPNMSIVSDRNDSIWKGVQVVFPGLPHYACMWHVWKNVCSQYCKSQDTLSSVYYQMAKSYRPREFQDLMEEVSSIDPRVKTYLVGVGYEKWARAYAPTNRGRMTTSNIAECINSCLVDARRLNILEFLEKVRELFAKWNRVNGDKARYMAASRLGDKFEDILTINNMRSARLTATKSSDTIYSVDDSGERYVVCLRSKRCTCNKFQYDELPCEHAMAVLRSSCIIDLMPYCLDYYKKPTLEKIYENSYPPMPLSKEWTAPKCISDDIVLPPMYRRPPGRPKGGRVRSKGETVKTSTNCCGKCGRCGHNRRSCSFFPKEM